MEGHHRDTIERSEVLPGSDKFVETIAWDLTYKCNLRCKHCFNYSGDHHFGRNELSVDELMIVAEQIAEIKTHILPSMVVGL